MRWLRLLAAFLVCGTLSAQERATNNSGGHFGTVDIYLDPQGQPLAAYQFELRAPSAQVKIVGIEGGAHPAFSEPPFYDPKALQHERVILAAFNTSPASKLPASKTRVAKLHLYVMGEATPRYSLKLQAVGTFGGKRIHAIATFEEGIQNDLTH